MYLEFSYIVWKGSFVGVLFGEEGTEDGDGAIGREGGDVGVESSFFLSRVPISTLSYLVLFSSVLSTPCPLVSSFSMLSTLERVATSSSS